MRQPGIKQNNTEYGENCWQVDKQNDNTSDWFECRIFTDLNMMTVQNTWVRDSALMIVGGAYPNPV